MPKIARSGRISEDRAEKVEAQTETLKKLLYELRLQRAGLVLSGVAVDVDEPIFS